MGHVAKMTDKPRSLPWRGHVHRKGHKAMVKMFLTKEEADHWVAEQERSLRMAGLPLTIDALKDVTVRSLVERYRDAVKDEKSPHHHLGYASDVSRLNSFLTRDICKKSIAYISKKDGEEYYEQRLKEASKRDADKTITPRTIRRELNLFVQVFELAKKDYPNLVNPFAGMKIKGGKKSRKRRLETGELDSLINACLECKGLNRYYMPLAIQLAVGTAMRHQEIFNLEWRDIDIGKRRIIIRKSKTDYLKQTDGRTIVITPPAMVILGLLRLKMGRTDKSERVFPMSNDAAKQCYYDVVKRAGLENLTFHDLRHEAASLFDEAGLTNAEHDLITGHANASMRSIYIHSELKRIEEKLDRYFLHGKTWNEYQDELEARDGRAPNVVKLLPVLTKSA